ncbi:MAG: hypothetical protein HY000_40355 [Planctomycetes bacterium]|nr:hypothetical protein [Planctomycetota bacterium]
MTTTTERNRFRIRTYRPGDETAQVEIYNAATAALPGFKPATAEEVARRYRAADFDPGSKLYAESEGRMVGYISFSPNGRISVPWCLAEAAEAREPLMNAALAAMKQRRSSRAWAAYRADWTEVRTLLELCGFRLAHEVVNFVAALAQLAGEAVAPPCCIEPLHRTDLEAVYAIDPTAFGVTSPDELGAAWCDGPYLAADSVFVLRQSPAGEIVAAGLAVTSSQYADPTKIDSAMPCFRLGAIGTESERTKRVNGLFSYVAQTGTENHRFARLLLGEACRRFQRVGILHIAAQCRSDRPVELALFDGPFQRQKSFPIFIRDL